MRRPHGAGFGCSPGASVKPGTVDESKREPRETSSTTEHACALHEVSNALTVVLGWLDAGSRAESLEDAKDAMSVALEHARRGLGLARGSIGAPVEMPGGSRTAAGLVEFLSLSLEPHAEQKGVRLAVELGSGLEHRPRDEASLLQVLTNLGLNAVAFSPVGGVVVLGAERFAEDFLFVVEDDGPGVPEEKVSTLFSFGGSSRAGGAGIGLSHSAELVRKRGGSLRYQRGARGARFELRWPILSSSSVRPVGGFAPGRSLAGLRLLLLEDDVAVLSLMELALEARGAEVVTTQTLDAFLDAARGAGPFDVALLDWSPLDGPAMADGCGSLVDALRALGGVPAVLVSGRPEGVPAGADGLFAAWIRKPFDLSQLVDEVARVACPEDRVPAVGFS